MREGKMLKDFAELLKDWEPNSGTSREAVERVQSELGIVFPQDYIELMEWSNGGEDWIGESYLRLWPMEEIPSMNESLRASEYAPRVVFLVVMEG